VETLTREHEAPAAEVQTPPETPPTTPEPTVACATCGAAMQPGQEWCLECGTARADRLSATRPSWRGGAAVLVVTGVLVAGAAAAAWAGLSADSKRVAASETQAALPAAQTQPPAAAQPPPAATTTQPPAATPPPAATTKKTTPPPAAKAPTTSTPATAAPAPAPAAPATPKATTTPKDTTSPQHAKPLGKLVAVDLQPTDAKTYNPYNRTGADQADPKLAIDGDAATAWTASIDPSANGQSAIGVDLALGKLTGIRQLKLTTPTPGMTIEIYGARTTDAPVSVQDPSWTHIATQLDVSKDGTIRLGSGTDKYRHLLIWITQAPPDGQQVSLGELKVYK
jgi:hypothetical protein